MDNLWIWLVVDLPYPPEKHDFVNWDDDIPNTWKKNHPNVPKHQPVYDLCITLNI